MKYFRGGWPVLYLIIIMFIATFCFDQYDQKVGFYHNDKFIIIATQSPTYWESGKFSGVDKRWLIKSIRDTSLYAEYNEMSSSDYYSYGNGDTITITSIRKQDFFKIKRK